MGVELAKLGDVATLADKDTLKAVDVPFKKRALPDDVAPP